MLINSFKFILEACDIVAMKIATSFSVLENFIGQPYVRHLVGVAIHSLLPIDSQCKQWPSKKRLRERKRKIYINKNLK